MGDVRRGTKSEIDKAHVLHAAEAESPWLEVSTVGLSCRLLIAGTMQQMALIAIPTHGLPALEFSFVLFLPHPEQSSPFFRRRRRRRRRRRFSRILLRGLPPRPIRSRHLATPCVRFHLADKLTT